MDRDVVEQKLESLRRCLLRIETKCPSDAATLAADIDLQDIVTENFDLRPGMIIKELNLKRPIYKKTASCGHFGRNDPDFTWETPKNLDHAKKPHHDNKHHH